MKIIEYKKKNGTIVYRANIYLGIDQVTGKKAKTSVTGRTRKEVKQKAKHAQDEFISNGYTVTKVVPIKNYQELAELWLESYQLTVKPQTFIATKRMLYNHLIPIFGTMKVDKLTVSYIQRFINDLSNQLVHYGVVHSINRRVLQYGVSLQLLPFNPARDVMLPKVPKKENKAIKFIAPEDLKALMAYMEKLANKKFSYFFDYVLYSVLLATGCRFGEVVALEWSDIDLENGTISITKNYSRLLKLIGTPKSKAGVRVISIDKKTINLLRLYKNRQRQLFIETGARVSAVVFSTPLKEYQNMATRQESLDRRITEVGIPRFTFHAFRHTHASLLLNAGISYKELQYRLGHATLAMTMDIYGHLSMDKEKEAVSYFEKAINNL
ncbi:TPA: site-specific integrase [Streptococcus pyogenes]|uniref:tyrosine-type recombinase/integrase n=1 Tax=Streptococcus TaxID=1301 RepID=UPI0003B958B4|nr:site-specific integrase [Streptococcus pyogenes]ESA53528.1 site-specific recombinase, phage integrase family [Streptococcus pyogenes GA40056]HER4567374.1 site-specific integrase [Streptococcus pyogenes NGAS640]EMC5219865.1 site-specific integrase [Streptococcus pyogenes]NAZ89201.1 tyrosine-type recombinase/integrase [Streptococcus pyogenes]NTS62180.1 site-specific integrase [Streptococcus pyogenes]